MAHDNFTPTQRRAQLSFSSLSIYVCYVCVYVSVGVSVYVGVQLMCLLACTANERGYAILSKRIRRVCPPVAARQVEQMSQRQNSQLDGNNNSSNNQINNDVLNLYPPLSTPLPPY